MSSGHIKRYQLVPPEQYKRLVKYYEQQHNAENESMMMNVNSRRPDTPDSPETPPINSSIHQFGPQQLTDNYYQKESRGVGAGFVHTKSTISDILAMLPVNMRKNSEIIMNSLASFPDSIFLVHPRTGEVVINGHVVKGSHFLDLIRLMHCNLPSSNIPIALQMVLFLLANYTCMAPSLLQSVKIRDIFMNMRKLST